MPSRKTNGTVVMSAIVLIGFYTLIWNNTNGLRAKEELAIPPPESSPTTSSTSSLKVVGPGQTTQPPQEQVMPVMERMDKKYNDGMFTVKSDFYTPTGLEGFDVTLVLKDDQIASVSTTFKATHAHSQAINDKLFVPGINGVVGGKEVDEATLRFAVNGASLHSIAFNEALEKVKQEALRSSHNLSYSDS